MDSSVYVAAQGTRTDTLSLEFIVRKLRRAGVYQPFSIFIGSLQNTWVKILLTTKNEN